jgi:dienelactone hydrolase
MISRLFRHWEEQLAAVDTNRIVRPFEWGLDWLDLDPATPDPGRAIAAWVDRTMQDTDAFFHAAPTTDYELTGDMLRFPSALVTPHEPNNVVTVRVFPAEQKPGQARRAVIVLPQWNADADGHVGLCRLFARFGITALRLSLPYHDARKPVETERAEYIVSTNVGRTLHANRQAVLDAKRTVDWAAAQGYRVGIVGTSLGSCLSMLTMSHDPRVQVGAFNHVSPYFADVVWRGLSTRHVREGLEAGVTGDALRQYWMPISPWPFIERVRGRKILLIYATYDLTFPLDLSRQFIAEFVKREVPHETAVLPCGHYTTGKAPFKFLDGYYLTKFLVKAL